MKKFFYEKSNIREFQSNVTYEEIVGMTYAEFREWLSLLKKEILDQWDIEDTPPVVGKSEEEIIESFLKLKTYPVHKFYRDDPDDDESLGVISNFTNCASAANQFFPTMLKTKISIGKTSDGALSIYDYFASEEKSESFETILSRTLKRDSMYLFSKSLALKDEDNDLPYRGESGIDWVRNFMAHKDSLYSDWEVWLCRKKDDHRIDPYVQLTADDLRILEQENLGGMLFNNLSDGIQESEELKNGSVQKYKYLITYFRKGQKIFPKALQIFRLSLGQQPAVNFPPLTARYLYERFTSHIDTDDRLIVYDPSSGWGGRILGAMASPKKLHYVGTDPNTDNFIDELGITRYAYLADFYNNNCVNNHGDVVTKFFEVVSNANTYHIFQEGSEVISNHPDFQQYKGKVDVAFTSPPYFNREQYSDDETQSFKAYSEYEDWRDNFLRPTLQTCYDWLNSDRYLIWNIASIKIGKDVYYDLEQDSIDIAKSIGFEYTGKLKMAMTRMLGLDPENLANSWYDPVDKKYLKYEPIFVFHKRS